MTSYSMYMIYIWWAIGLCLLFVVLIIQATVIPVGQRRLHSILRFIQVSSIVVLTVILTVMIGPWLAILSSLCSVIVLVMLSRIRFIKQVAQYIYTKQIVAMLPWIANQRWLDYLTDGTAIGKKIHLESADELTSIIENAHFLRHNEVVMLNALISHRDMSARQAMQPIQDIKTIDSSEVIGPLLLDELHRTRQSFFGVVNSSGIIIGSVHLDQLVEMSHVSTHVKDIMHHEVLRVNPTVPLRKVLDNMITENVSLAIVHDGQDIGAISLNDAVAALLGKVSK